MPCPVHMRILIGKKNRRNLSNVQVRIAYVKSKGLIVLSLAYVFAYVFVYVFVCAAAGMDHLACLCHTRNGVRRPGNECVFMNKCMSALGYGCVCVTRRQPYQKVSRATPIHVRIHSRIHSRIPHTPETHPTHTGTTTIQHTLSHHYHSLTAPQTLT